MRVRCYQKEDAAIAWLFTESVRTTNARDYSPEQIAAWAGHPPDVEHWRKRLDSYIAFVAEDDSEVIGFITFEADGHLDHLYVHSRFQRQGVASALYRRVAEEAVTRNVYRIFAEASITARPFFEAVGFRVIASQSVEHREISFMNYRMERLLPRSGWSIFQPCEL
jgi:putative acetyltransferase